VKPVKALLILAAGFLAATGAWGQDISPRGPSEWTATNWLGFALQVGLFLLAVFAVYLAAGKDEPGEGEK